MAAGHGGTRTGAGRKNKPLAEKVLNGNPGCRKLKVVDFPAIPDLKGGDMPSAREFLSEAQKDNRQILASEIYAETWRWLDERGCASLIPAQMLEQYAMSFARWIQCERHVSEYGFLSKHPTTKAPIPSPFVTMSQTYNKQASTIWYQIYQIVRENCSAEFKDNPHVDMMEKLLSGRQ